MAKNQSLKKNVVLLSQNGSLADLQNWDYAQLARLLKDKEEFVDINRTVKLDEIGGGELLQLYKDRGLGQKFGLNNKAPPIRQLETLLKAVEAAASQLQSRILEQKRPDESVHEIQGKKSTNATTGNSKTSKKQRKDQLNVSEEIVPITEPKSLKEATPPMEMKKSRRKSTEMTKTQKSNKMVNQEVESGVTTVREPERKKRQVKALNKNTDETLSNKENVAAVAVDCKLATTHAKVKDACATEVENIDPAMQPKIDKIFLLEDETAVNKRRRSSQGDTRRGLVPPPPTKKRRPSTGENQRISTGLNEANVFQHLSLVEERVASAQKPLRLVFSYSGRRSGNQWIIEEAQQLACKLENLAAEIADKIKSVAYEHKPRVAATHLFVPEEQDRPTLKIFRTLRLGGQILLPAYLSEVLNQKEWPLECPEDFEHPKWPKLSSRLSGSLPLDGLMIYLFGQFSDKNIPKLEIQLLIRLMGGIVSANIRTSDIIVLSDGIRELPSTISELIKQSIEATSPRSISPNKFVKVEWIIDSLSRWAKAEASLHEPLVVQTARKRAGQPSSLSERDSILQRQSQSSVSERGSQRETDPLQLCCTPTAEAVLDMCSQDDVESSTDFLNKSEDEILDSDA